MTTYRRERPLLVFDGDCGFCRYWVRYWQQLTGRSVDYAPYQEVGHKFPQISQAQFARSIQYIGTDGNIASGAEASYLTLSHAPGKAFWLILYRVVPGFAWVTELLYAFIARHRIAAGRLSRVLWGKRLEPARFELLSNVFLRLMGLIYLAAFASFGVQILGLVGSHGILPAHEFLRDLSLRFGFSRFWYFPNVFWINDSDSALQAVCLLGAILSLLVALNIGQRFALIVLFPLYLSIFYIGQTFTTFQWDLFLIEAGFLAIFLAPGLPTVIWLFRWLLFRFIFLGGLVKILSGDTAWRNLTALSYHFETQPLPTPLAWYANRLPEAVKAFGTGATLVIELGVVFLIFMPRRLRFIGAWSIVLLQSCILLTGNYNFFNLLTLALCLTLFDDQALRAVLPRPLATRPWRAPAVRARWQRIIVPPLAVVLVLLSLLHMGLLLPSPMPRPLIAVMRAVEPLHIVNNYGPFATMTRSRPEIIVQGSNDGKHWKAYGWRYKPGNVMRAPSFNIPHQPRLDWQMWFAALSPTGPPLWFDNFIQRLLEGSSAVLALLGHNPFPKQPPKYVRALLYDYRFSSTATRSKTGQWWVRSFERVYYPETSLGDNGGTINEQMLLPGIRGFAP